MPTTSGGEAASTSAVGSSSDTTSPAEPSTTLGDDTTGPSAGTDSGDATDTGEPPPPFPSGPFGDPVPVTVLNEGGLDEDDPALSPDGLELYFESNRGTGFGDLYVSRRSDLASPWQPPERVPGVGADNAHDGTPGIMADGVTMLFTSTRPGSFLDDVYVSKRANLGAPWGPATRVDVLSSTADDLGPRAVPGGGLFLCSDRMEVTSVGSDDLWLFEEADPAAGTYSAPVIVAHLSSAYDDCMLMMAQNGLEVFFDSNRPPSVNEDLWSATRPDLDADLDEAFPLDDLNTVYAERDPYVSPDGHELYFSTNREGGYDIWMATR